MTSQMRHLILASIRAEDDFSKCLIGVKNSEGKSSLPWKNLKDDMKFFRTVTSNPENNTVIVGNTTFKEIGKLPKRINVVLTRNANLKSDISDIKYCCDVETALYCYDNSFIIGGKEIYEEAIKELNEFGYEYIIYHTDIVVSEDEFKSLLDNDSTPVFMDLSIFESASPFRSVRYEKIQDHNDYAFNINSYLSSHINWKTIKS